MRTADFGLRPWRPSRSVSSLSPVFSMHRVDAYLEPGPNPTGRCAVGAAGHYYRSLRDGPAAGRRLPRLHALARAHRALAARHLPRTGRTGTARLDLCLRGRGGQARSQDGGHAGSQPARNPGNAGGLKGIAMPIVQKITPCLCFDNQAEEAAKFYVSLFPNSAIGTVTRYGKEGFEVHGRPEGSVMTVSFRLEGQEFTALNGGPHFKFTEAISFVVRCETQTEVDHYWDKLGEGGDERAQRCGWLKDKYGVSWQILPAALFELMGATDAGKAQRVMRAMLQMKKLDLKVLRRAYEGIAE